MTGGKKGNKNTQNHNLSKFGKNDDLLARIDLTTEIAERKLVKAEVRKKDHLCQFLSFAVCEWRKLVVVMLEVSFFLFTVLSFP